MQTCEYAPFTSPDTAIRGWKTTIPGRRPLATPAYANGRLFLGGGFGSHEFYSLDANTGQMLWCYHTKDDGPTAAIVVDDLVAFNTESCELEVLTVEGRAVWKQWLGDPLMSMPASANGRIFMAYPDSRGDRRHYLACFDLRSGEAHWRTPIAGEIITAPVLTGDRVYLTTMDGTVSCFRQDNGEQVWQDPLSATSSPVVWNEKCFFSRRREVMDPRQARMRMGGSRQTERLSKRGLTAACFSADMESTMVLSDYLDYDKRSAGSHYERDCEVSDSHVGFAHSKGDSKMDQARRNIGTGSVRGCWAYQGSKPFLSGERVYSSMGDTLKKVHPETDEVFWEKQIYPREDGKELLDSVLTPPALVNDKVFVGTMHGDVCCLSASSGDEIWRVKIEEPIAFQPCVANGRVYVATSHGSVYCLETGDANDDGWYMWGRDAGHNGEKA